MADCYCSKKGIPGEKPKCIILSGGVKDREYYTELAHEISTGIPCEPTEHKGITVTARLDPTLMKECMITNNHLGSLQSAVKSRRNRDGAHTSYKHQQHTILSQQYNNQVQKKKTRTLWQS